MSETNYKARVSPLAVTARRKDLDFDWDQPLSSKSGGYNLAGLTVYHDFKWTEVFPHGKATFRNGRSLALFVKNRCPADRTPCLLLTTKDDVAEETIHTDTHYGRIVRIRRYLKVANADPATTYFAKDALLDQYLDRAELLQWARGDANRIAMLRQVADTLAAGDDPPSIISSNELIQVIGALDQITPDICDAMLKALSIGGPDELRRVAEWLSSNTDGRQAASEALADRIESRMADVHSKLEEYRQLLEQNAKEADLQNFIKGHPLLLGLEYVRVLSRQDIPGAEVDFLVERHDGYHDLLELKRPGDEIIRCSAAGQGPHPPSKYSLSAALSKALAQVQIYRERLTRNEVSMEVDYGIKHTGYPRVIIIIGREGELSPTEERILRQMNLSLHRIEVMPYDWLAKRAETQLYNLEKILSRHKNAENGDEQTE